MLSVDQTLELIKLAQSGDNDAKTALLQHNLPLIKSIVRRYQNKQIEYDDLIQLGTLGFIKALNNFNTDFGVRFSTYAVPMIAGEIKRFIRDNGAIKVSRSIKSQNQKINKFIEEYRQNNPEIFKVSDNRRRAKKKALPADLTAKQWDKNMKYFNYSCALTGKKENIHQEHFIPISILHGGTTEENMYPMEGCLNVSKSNKNPFEWIKEQPEEYQNNFHNNLVPYMAKKNKMQVKEYEDFVYWCFANPRTLEQAEKDNKEGLTSKDLFYQSINLMGGIDHGINHVKSKQEEKEKTKSQKKSQ